MKEVRSPKRPLLYYYLIALGVILLFNMSLVNMGGKYKLVLATQYFFCQLHPDLMGFLGGNLPWLKGLDQVAAQVRALVDGMTAGPFKLDVGGLGGAAKGGNQ